MPLQETSGAASYDAFGGAQISANYIEDVFSTFLYTGNGTSQTISNGIDLVNNGGLVWVKQRSTARSNVLFDTTRGVTQQLISNSNVAQTTNTTTITSFNSNGFSVGSDTASNANAGTYASWTFREQAKFFDVVAYTGDGSNPRSIAHNLGSTPGCMIIKRTSTSGTWFTYHNSLTVNQYLALETSSAVTGATGIWGSGPTSTTFTVNAAGLNAAGETYIAYLFAHNAGGFGLSNADNVISCGSYTGNGNNAGPTVNLGYEPQWIMIKNSSAVGNWQIVDSMRGIYFSYNEATLQANLTDAETLGNFIRPVANGFILNTTSTEFNTTGNVYVYIAIRRGPMEIPTSGSTVFALNNRFGTGSNATVTGLPVTDAVLIKNSGTVNDLFATRLNGTGYLVTSTNGTEPNADATILQANPWDVMNGVEVGTTSSLTNASANEYINYLFRRAPRFMDVAYYLGTGAVVNQPHNLSAVPELIFVKRRDVLTNWTVYYGDNTSFLVLNGTNATSSSITIWNNTTPTSSVFTLGTSTLINNSAGSYIAWLFSTCPGVSKVGTFTGTGATQVIDCGFTTGARFVLVKSISATGNWYVWDSARGIVPSDDPYFLLNTNAAWVTNTNWVNAAASGFELTNSAGNLANSSGVSYVFLAIA